MLNYFKKLNNPVAKFVWVFITPILITILIFLYFLKWYGAPLIFIPILDAKKYVSPSKVVFDPIEIRNLLPNYIGQNLKFMLCLHNRNQILDNQSKLFDMNLFPEGFVDEKRTVGAMAVRVSKIPDLQLYRERGMAECQSIDMEKLLLSDVTSEINNGPLFTSLNETDSKNLVEGKPVQALLQQMSIDFSKTLLYARMQWNHLIFIFFGINVAWFGFVLLFKNVISFVFRKN